MRTENQLTEHVVLGAWMTEVTFASLKTPTSVTKVNAHIVVPAKADPRDENHRWQGMINDVQKVVRARHFNELPND